MRSDDYIQFHEGHKMFIFQYHVATRHHSHWVKNTAVVPYIAKLTTVSPRIVNSIETFLFASVVVDPYDFLHHISQGCSVKSSRRIKLIRMIRNNNTRNKTRPVCILRKMHDLERFFYIVCMGLHKQNFSNSSVSAMRLSHRFHVCQATTTTAINDM